MLLREKNELIDEDLVDFGGVERELEVAEA